MCSSGYGMCPQNAFFESQMRTFESFPMLPWHADVFEMMVRLADDEDALRLECIEVR